MDNKSNKSTEDYLESILVLNEQKGYARSVDVAEDLGVTKPSVSVAMKKLREQGYIIVGDEGHLMLTKEGRKIAENVYSKHKLLRNVLQYIGVDKDTASDEACLIEHVISDSTYEKINEFYKKLQS